MHWIDPAFLPETAGTVERFVVNPHGEIDGLIMADGGKKPVLVHVPPHLEQALQAAVRPRDVIKVRGVRPRRVEMIAAVAVIASSGETICDEGPDKSPKPTVSRGKPERMSVSGRVSLSLYGPKGELRGALLDEGSIVRVGSKEAQHCRNLLQPGASIAARGAGLRTVHGRVVTAEEIGPSLNDLRRVKVPKPEAKPEPKHKKDGRVAEHPNSEAGR